MLPLSALVPVGRVGQVDDIANVAAFLASPVAGYINGGNLRVEGGLVARLVALRKWASYSTHWLPTPAEALGCHRNCTNAQDGDAFTLTLHNGVCDAAPSLRARESSQCCTGPGRPSSPEIPKEFDGVITIREANNCERRQLIVRLARE